MWKFDIRLRYLNFKKDNRIISLFGRPKKKLIFLSDEYSKNDIRPTLVFTKYLGFGFNLENEVMSFQI